MKYILSIAIILSVLAFASCSDDESTEAQPEPPAPEQPQPPSPAPNAPQPDATHFVGPSHTAKKLQDLTSQLKPGDVVEVEGKR